MLELPGDGGEKMSLFVVEEGVFSEGTENDSMCSIRIILDIMYNSLDDANSVYRCDVEVPIQGNATR